MPADLLHQEPKNGDFVSYINALQKGKIKTPLMGPGAVVFRKDDGSLAVDTAKNVAAAKVQQEAKAPQKSALPIERFFRFFGIALAVGGGFLFVKAMNSPEDTGSLPVAGMIMMFIGTVLYSQITQSIRRRNRNKK